MIATFEAIAQLCDQPIVNSEGLRLFGGHSIRVTGAQALADSGVEVAKLRILARHSGDTILRYVAESPLSAMRTDLGLSTAASSSSGIRAPLHDTAVADISKRLRGALRKITHQQSQIEALLTMVSKQAIAIFVENVTSQATHAMRPGGGSHTICGWHVGTRTVSRTGARFSIIS